MADDLVFKVKFDLQKGVDEALKDGDKALERIEKVLGKHPITIKLRMDNRVTRGASAELTGFKKQLTELTQQWNSLTAAERGSAAGAAIREKFRALRTEAQGYTSTLQAAVKTEDKMRESYSKTAASANKLSSAYHNQSGYLDRLIKRMAVYASFRYASQFLTNIREVTAEFELQRISLGAIIQDQQKANQIFAEIKSFALTSPLKILDLTKYTKQVAAYGFETEKLFDTTKMLADISVGLGSDMSRVTLFLGQVYATGYLRASELRQATELGIPLVDKLATKLEELNGKAYTAAEVSDLISKRAISFELVEQVFKDMTSAGGEFYNMQVKQSQTLFGMWSKLGDAAAIMYDQIGNTSSINAGMKLAIRSIEQMMRNWKTTARVLDSVAVATAVYIVGLKNAAIASKALTSAVALENLAHQQQIIRTPKIIAGIIGINNAKKISTLLTNLHTKAVLSEAAATNVLTKGFWKLTAAMLANPWVAAASAIALVGVALFHFIGNTETAAERAEKLNNSVASLKNLDDTTKPLIDTYNELINKTERTAEEQKKLSEVTHELAKQYPGAITAIGNFGEEVELAADKLNQLYQVEKQARMDNTRHELEKTEQKITETEEKIVRLQAQLQDGTKTVTVGSSITGYTQTVTVQMSDEDKGKVLKQIDELRYGEDGQSGLFGLQQSAEAARRALGLLPSEAAQAVEKFGAWKKNLSGFYKFIATETTDTFTRLQKVKLFDDSTIAQFGSLEEALKKTAEEYKKNIALVATYDETLKSATLTSEERAKIETERAEADAMANLAEKALKYYNAMSLLNTSTSGRSRSGTKSDPRLQTLQEIANKMAEVNKEYDELLKKEGQTKALADTQKLFASSFKQMEATAKKYKFKLPAFEVPQTIEDVQKWYKAIMDNIKRLKLKNADKVLIELGFKSDKAAIDKQQKDIEKQLKELSDRISRTKTAKEFYEKILGMTGDYDLAAKVSLSIYGDTGYNLQKQLAEQIRTYFDNENVKVEIPVDVITADNQINYKRLGEFAEQMKEKLGEEPYKAIKKIAEEGKKDLAKTYEGYLKDLEKAKIYADKRVELARTTAAKIREIESNPQLTKEQKAELKRGYQERESVEAARLEYDAFKETPLYIQMFEDLEHASTSTLEMMKRRLERLKGVWGTALDPTQLKDIQSRMNEIDEQLRTRNPFKTLKESYQQYRDAVKGVSLFGAVQNAGAAAKDLYNLSEKYGADSAQARAAATELNARREIVKIARKITAENKKGAKALDAAAQIANDNLKIARGHLDIAKEQEEAAVSKAEKEGKDPAKDPGVLAAREKVEAAKEEANLAERVAEITTNYAHEAKTWKESLSAAAETAFVYLNAASDLAHSIADLTEEFGGSEEDAQYWNDIGDALGNIAAGAQDLIKNILDFNVAGMVSSIVTALPKMAIGFSQLFSAGKVRKANKEIKRQQQILDQLEYTYSRLEAKADKLFGRDYVNNYNQQLKNLQAQQQAYLKQAEAERSKGKKEDKEKTKEYEEQARDTADKIKELQDDLVAHFTGSSRTDVARQMAQSWIDARASMSDTFAAIKGDYQDLIKNMIVEGAAARVIENALTPVWDSMEAMLAKNDVEGAIDSLVNGMDSALNAANNGMEVLWKALEARGYDMKKLIGDTDSEYTGIAKSVAGATSEEILQLSGFVNTALYHTAYLPKIYEELVAMRTASLPTATVNASSAGWTDWQQQAMDNYNAIARNTANTVVECRRAADACEKLARAVRTKGSTSGFNVFLNS